MRKDKKKQKTSKKIVAAFAMFALSASMLGTATYAWFTMNRKVTVTGMTLHTKVSENLLIADDTINSTAVKTDNLFNNSLVQLVDGLIEPVSTVNGKDFFYTAGTNVQGNGAVLNKTWSAYNPSDTSGFAAEYALSGSDVSAVKGYVDYVYQLKAINGSTASEIRLTGLNVTYGGTNDNSQKATRVAVFAEDLGYKTGSDSSNIVAAKGNFTDEAVVLKAIYTPSGSNNFSITEGTDATKADAVDSITTRADVTYNEKFVLPVGTNQTRYYKILVRVWLEGEDTTCNNTTFMDLTDKWSVDMQWDLVATATADSGDAAKVANITSTVSAGKANVSAASVNSTVAYTISGQNYYEINTVTLGTEKLYTTSTSLSSTSHIFTISSNGLYPTDVTNQCTLPVTP